MGQRPTRVERRVIIITPEVSPAAAADMAPSKSVTAIGANGEQIKFILPAQTINVRVQNQAGKNVNVAYTIPEVSGNYESSPEIERMHNPFSNVYTRERMASWIEPGGFVTYGAEQANHYPTDWGGAYRTRVERMHSPFSNVYTRGN